MSIANKIQIPKNTYKNYIERKQNKNTDYIVFKTT